MIKTFEIILDLEKELYQPIANFSISQLDFDSVDLLFTIRANESDVDLTGSTVRMAIEKPSGLSVFQDCEITAPTAGEVRVRLSNQSYVEYGMHRGELYIDSGESTSVTCDFFFMSKDAVMDDESLESSNDWAALKEALLAYDKKPILTDGIPTFAPEYYGQTAIDTVGERAFIAYGTTAADWNLISAGEGGGGIVSWADILGKPLTFPPDAHSHGWDEITGKPTTFPIALHRHTIEEIDNLQAALDAKADSGEVGGTVTWETIEGKPADFPPSAHFHTAADITDFGTSVRNELPVDLLSETEGDLRYQPKGDYITAIPAEYLTATEGDLRYQPSGDYLTAIPAEYLTETEGDLRYQAAGTIPDHQHTSADITDFGTGVAANIPADYLTQTEADIRYSLKGSEGGTVQPAEWGQITGDISLQTDLQTALAGKADDADLAAKADSDHQHTSADITDFGTAVASAIPANYLTSGEADLAYQPIGDYLTAIPAEYLTQTEGNAAYQPIGDYLTAVPAEYLTESEGDLRYQGIGTVPTHQHTSADISDFGTAVAGAIPAEYLTATEGNNTYQPKGDYLTAIPAEYLTATEGDLAYQPKGDYLTSIPDHQHTSADITDFGTAVAGAIPAEYLTATEGDLAYQPKGTYLTAVPLMGGNQIGGAMVGNGLAMAGNYLLVKRGAGIGLAADNSITTESLNGLKLWSGTAAEYAAITTPDPTTLYFVSG